MAPPVRPHRQSCGLRAADADANVPQRAPPEQRRAVVRRRTRPAGRRPGGPHKAADLPGLFTRLYPGRITPAKARTGRIIDDGKEAQFAHFRWNGFATSVGFAAYFGTPAQRCRELQQVNVPPGRPPTPVTCTRRPDGSVLMTSRDAGDGGLVAIGVSLITMRGYEIDVISYNKSDFKSRPVLSAEPPFSISQLTQAVTSDVWFG